MYIIQNIKQLDNQMLTYCLLKQIGTHSDTPLNVKTNFKYTYRQNFKIILGFSH